MFALAELAVAENESWTNNSTGEFCDRFQVYLGGTSVPFAERLSLLEELMARPDPAYSQLAVNALGAACNLNESRMLHGEKHHSRVVERQWHPESQSAACAIRREALAHLAALTRRATPELEQTLAEATIRLIGPMLFAGFIEEVVELARSVARAYPSRKERLRTRVAEMLDAHATANGTSVPALTALSGLQKELTDGSLAGRLRQYVGKENWDFKSASDQLLLLAREFITRPELVSEFFEWLTSGKANSCWEFGQLLGEHDRKGQLFERVTCVGDRGPDLRFTAAYLIAFAKHHASGWLESWIEKQFQSEAGDDPLVLEITWRTEPTDSGVSRIFRLLDRGRLPETAYSCLGYSSWSQKMSVQPFIELLARLRSCRRFAKPHCAWFVFGFTIFRRMWSLATRWHWSWLVTRS